MKIYSQILKLENPKTQTFFTPQFSDYKLGIKVVKNDLSADGQLTVKLGSTELPADPDKTDEYTTYTQKSGSTGKETFKVEYSEEGSVIQVFEINHVTTDSSVFEVGGEGGGDTPVGNFVRSVNGELPINGNVNLDKIALSDGFINGDTILASLNNIDEELEKKADLTAITPTAPSTSAGDDDLAGAKATANFVNSSINALAAFYITKQNGEQFENWAELIAGPWYCGGEEREPTQNDYAIVKADENYEDATTRYSYQNEEWTYQYTINRTPLTQAQLDALNSGITANKVNDMVYQSQLNANVITLAGEYDDGETFSFEVYVHQ